MNHISFSWFDYVLNFGLLYFGIGSWVTGYDTSV